MYQQATTVPQGLPNQAVLATASFIPPPPGIATTKEVAFEIGTDKVHQITDPQNRRLFEGWGCKKTLLFCGTTSATSPLASAFR